jgi:hypothetical protein
MRPLPYLSPYLRLSASNNPKVLNKISLNLMLIVHQFQILLKLEDNNSLLLEGVAAFLCGSRV